MNKNKCKDTGYKERRGMYFAQQVKHKKFQDRYFSICCFSFISLSPNCKKTLTVTVLGNDDVVFRSGREQRYSNSYQTSVPAQNVSHYLSLWS